MIPNIPTCKFFMQSIKDMIFSKHVENEIPHVFTVNNNNEIIKKINTVQNFKPNKLAKSGKAHTMLQIMSYLKKLNYEREYVFLRDGHQINIDWKYLNNEKFDHNNAPIILILHGLGGNSQSSYIKRFTNLAINKGYKVAIYNRRWHTDSFVHYNNCLPFPKHVNMEDMEDIVDHINKIFPNNKKYLVGFSVGANLAIKYYEKNKDNPFDACVSISNGYNIYKGLRMMEDKDTIKIVCNFMKELLNKKVLDNIKQYNKDIDLKKVLESKSLLELENNLIVPLYKYNNIEEYYNEDSCHLVIDKVSKPLLCICSKDDPFVNPELIDIPINASMKNDKIITIVTNSGGHIGWTDQDFNPWYADVVFEYFNAL